MKKNSSKPFTLYLVQKWWDLKSSQSQAIPGVLKLLWKHSKLLSCFWGGMLHIIIAVDASLVPIYIYFQSLFPRLVKHSPQYHLRETTTWVTYAINVWIKSFLPPVFYFPLPVSISVSLFFYSSSKNKIQIHILLFFTVISTLANFTVSLLFISP